MNIHEDKYGHVTVRCGWMKFAVESPDKDEKLVVLEKGTHYVSIAEYDTKNKKWINAADDTDLDIEYWMYVPSLPDEDMSSEDETE